MENLYILLAVFVALELYETTWQKSKTFFGLIEKNFYFYKKGIFTYLSMNPTFFYTIFLIFGMGYDEFWMLTIFVLKFVDIAFRIYIMQKISKSEDLEILLSSDMKMNLFLRYFNVVIYPSLFLISTF
jgi:hypothetical protein